MVSLEKPSWCDQTTQLQHPHSSIILAKLVRPLPPRSTSQTHVHTPWITNLRLP